MIRSGFAAVISVLAIMSLQADTLKLDYASLYSHTRKLDKETMPALQFAFGFAHKDQSHLCGIKRAFIRTQKQDIPLKVTAEQRFTVPSERALKLAEAVVNVELDEMAQRCDMSVQLETREDYLRADYSLDELKMLQRQYTAFFDQMGGFMSFLMPSVQGLIMHFEQPLKQAVMADGQHPEPGIRDSQLQISRDWLAQQQESNVLNLQDKPRRIVAWVE
ncbi:DUF2987 domain-containing protein [Lacimicrobium alkaliphilum]|uniref:DUF2987 domain-containing protein n=1 Tax=Lacimicrobium alkaliphilum TaxID=1526571 RepID=A0ABQ1QZC7_9ALTE|nr:DUF2987 domain-containing protein [Lacimicrobium alkaliphilum]GGD52702.1 hypothetical protein GCM10011357_05720 [Lacimicrobium alkaliphilum]